MGLNEKHEMVTRTWGHYLYLEMTGSIPENAPKIWGTLHQHMAEIRQKEAITGAISQYKVSPQPVYRAGVLLEKKPTFLPQGFKTEAIEGGKYACFTLTGSYSQLPQASGRVFEIIEKEHLPVREGFFIENYVNNPDTTPEKDLITEILIPVR